MEVGCSNHLIPTGKKPLIDIFRDFLLPDNSTVADKVADNMVPRRPLKSVAGYPYMPARLVHHGMSITRKWYIQFRVWDIIQNKLLRKRVMMADLAHITDMHWGNHSSLIN